MSHTLRQNENDQGQTLVSQQSNPSAEDSINCNGENGWSETSLSCMKDTPIAGESGSRAAVNVLQKVDDKANDSHAIELHAPPSAPSANVKDDVSHDSGCRKRRKRGGWITTPFIFGADAAETLAVAASHVNLITYLVQVMHQETLQSATVINTFSSTSAFAPLLGAFVADSYLGRYATILYASFFYMAGLILITISAVTPSLQPPPCKISSSEDENGVTSCSPATSLHMGVVYVALSLMVVGSGGIRPCVSPFGASQFDQNDPKENAQLKSYFNWYFFSVMVAELIAMTLIVYIQDYVSWGWGFGISAAVMLLAITTFTGGSFLYRFTTPQGSAFTRMAQVLVAAFRKRHLDLPSDSSLLYFGCLDDFQEGPDPNCCSSPHSMQRKLLTDMESESPVDGTDLDSPRCSRKSPILFQPKGEELMEGAATEEGNEEKVDQDKPSFLQHSPQFRFFDRAAIEVESDRVSKYNLEGEMVTMEPSRWRLCRVPQVEELKSVIRLVPMWATGLMTGLSMAQSSTYMIQQARTMDRRMGSFEIPPASIRVLSIITILVWLPFFDRFLVPKLIAPRTGHPRGFTYLQKIGIGYGLQSVSMAIAIIVEHERRATARKHGFIDRPQEVIPFSAFTLVPLEIVGGIATSFSLTGHFEFYYHMVPEHITSTASAFGHSSFAVGTLLASVLLNAVQRITESASHPGWLDENLNKAHLDYFYIITLFLQVINFIIYVCFVSKWYRKQLIDTECKIKQTT
ncbi:hypothetical protein R1sor_005143 [Riccia sorocarpa]|uniref:Uncharacterized protein n=1 Tax=Riccia sorocarpa TaxID=122646 RepID=A0ABD3HLP5_9MARC